MLCALLEIILSFVPRAQLRRMFPPIVTGVCVLCIGVALTGTGIKYWGGGAFCADHSYKRMTVIKGPDAMLPGGKALGFSPGGACGYDNSKLDSR